MFDYLLEADEEAADYVVAVLRVVSRHPLQETQITPHSGSTRMLAQRSLNRQVRSTQIRLDQRPFGHHGPKTSVDRLVVKGQIFWLPGWRLMLMTPLLSGLFHTLKSTKYFLIDRTALRQSSMVTDQMD